MTETKSFKEWTDEYVRDNIHKLKAPMTKYVHIVYVHPVENSLPNLHKVKAEREFDTKEQADAWIVDHNSLHDPYEWNYKAVYYGCVNDATGELV
jgi:hypothetical protein